jgi:hypothetical protein
MTRPSKKTIEPLLDEYARLEARRISIELRRDQELAPLRAAFEKKAGPIVADAKAKCDTIQKRMFVLANDINAQLMAGVDQKAETIALAEVSVEIETTKSIALLVAQRNKAEGQELRTNDAGRPTVRAIASVDAKPGDRAIEPEKFYSSVGSAERGSSFWGCFKVLISNAEKFLGKEKVDQLAKKPKSYSVSIALKP